MKKQEIFKTIDEIIDQLVIQLNEPILDDMYPDLLADGDKRQEAFEYLLDILEKEFGYTAT